MQKLKPKDIVAILTLVGIGILKLKGVDGQLDVFGALILGYYFAHRADKIDSGK